MARNKLLQTNINNSNPALYPDGRIKDNTGAGDGTPVNEAVYGDIHEAFAKMMRLYGISYNNLPDNEDNEYQLVEAIRSLASKNDYILNIANDGLILTVPFKLGVLIEGEQVVCNSSVNLGLSTQIRGIDGVIRNVTAIGSFQIGEYVRMINTATNIVLIRLVDGVNLDIAIGELSYLKAATLAEELAGLLDTVATTPETNLLAFVERVNGATSDQALAIANVRNGLLSKEDKAKLDGLGGGSDRFGTAAIGDINSSPVGTTFPVTGDLQQCQLTQKTGGGDVYTITLTTAMADLNYTVKQFVQSLGNIDFDNDFNPVVFKVISPTQFRVYYEETGAVMQNITIHIEVKQR